MVQIGTIQTYGRRVKLDDLVYNPFFVSANIILIDEAHRSLSRTYQQVLNLYKDKVVIGVTATPCLSSGLGMGNFYEAIVDRVGVQKLIDGGHLVPARYFSGSSPDLKGIKTVRGDWDIKELGKRSGDKKLVGDVYDNWARIAPGKQTICFAVNRKHSKALCREFQSKGVSAEFLDSYSDDEHRADVLRRLESGDIQVLMNVGLFTEGFDYPGVECIILARPTKSMGLYRQMVGRGLRPAPGKSEVLVIDHGRCVFQLGFVEDPVYWSLDGKLPAYKKKVVRKKEKTVMECDECRNLFTGRRCPQCGLEVQDWGKKIEAAEAELVEVGKNKKTKPSMEEKERFYGMLEHYRRKKGYKPGWVSWKYREKFNVWPKGLKTTQPIEPDVGFYNWLKYLNIKAAKAREKERSSDGIMIGQVVL
jgi:superfamily II DNA or RNA helicase